MVRSGVAVERSGLSLHSNNDSKREPTEFTHLLKLGDMRRAGNQRGLNKYPHEQSQQGVVRALFVIFSLLDRPWRWRLSMPCVTITYGRSASRCHHIRPMSDNFFVFMSPFSAHPTISLQRYPERPRRNPIRVRSTCSQFSSENAKNRPLPIFDQKSKS